MFRFGSQALLLGYVLVPLLAVFFWYAARWRRRSVARFGDVPLMRRLSESVSRRARAIKMVLTLLSIACLVTALARPQFGTRVETVTRKGQDVMVAIDVSTSMLAEDIVPNRLAKAKHTVGSLIGRLRGDRVGLVAFAGEAFVQSPLTVDYAAAMMFLNAIEPDIIPVAGTDLGAALDVALRGFDDTDQDYRVLVVMTDGEDHEAGIEEQVRRAKENGVRIFTVGFGSPEGVPIPQFDATGARTGFKRDENGDVVTSRLDEATLRQIADATGGRYFRASASESELDDLIEEIAAEEGRELEAREVTQFDEQYQIFLGMALAFLVLEVLVSDRRRVTSAWRGRFA
jgi:Ca-activated chloride channel homolog